MCWQVQSQMVDRDCSSSAKSKQKFKNVKIDSTDLFPQDWPAEHLRGHLSKRIETGSQQGGEYDTDVKEIISSVPFTLLCYPPSPSKCTCGRERLVEVRSTNDESQNLGSFRYTKRREDVQ